MTSVLHSSTAGRARTARLARIHTVSERHTQLQMRRKITGKEAGGINGAGNVGEGILIGRSIMVLALAKRYVARAGRSAPSFEGVHLKASGIFFIYSSTVSSILYQDQSRDIGISIRSSAVFAGRERGERVCESCTVILR